MTVLDDDDTALGDHPSHPNRPERFVCQVRVVGRVYKNHVKPLVGGGKEVERIRRVGTNQTH